MNSQSIDKQIINWNIYTFQHLTTITDLIQRVQTKQKPNAYDFKIRDFYFNPNTQLFGIKNRTTFIEYASEIVKNFLSFNQIGYLQSVAFDRHMDKHKFWNKLYSRSINTKQDAQIRSSISNILWSYRLIPFTIFLFGGATILRVSGVYRMSLKKQLTGLVLAGILGEIFVKIKKSSDIFYHIPSLSNQSLQAQRIDILNKTLVLDAKINETQFQPEYVDELIDEADKQQNEDMKKQILQAAGFIVVDRFDFQYK